MPDFETSMAEGRRLSAQGKYAPAHRAFTEACAQCPDSASAWCNLGAIAFMRQRFDEAATHYNRARTLQPGAEEAAFGMVRVHMAQSQWNEARTALETLQPAPATARCAEWHYLTGLTAEHMHDTEKARHAYQAAAQLGYPPALKIWPRFLLQHEDAATAVRACFEISHRAKTRWSFVADCLRQQPDHLALYDVAADLFLSAHQFAYAARVAARAQRAVPEIHFPDWPALKACTWS